MSPLRPEYDNRRGGLEVRRTSRREVPSPTKRSRSACGASRGEGQAERDLPAGRLKLAGAVSPASLSSTAFRITPTTSRSAEMSATALASAERPCVFATRKREIDRTSARGLIAPSTCAERRAL